MGRLGLDFGGCSPLGVLAGTRWATTASLRLRYNGCRSK